jgi:hypothetical protein
VAGRRFTTTITEDGGQFNVIWRVADEIVGAVPVRDRATAGALKAQLDRGVAPVDAIYRTFRPPRRPAVADSSEAAARYGRLGAAARNNSLTSEQRREIARRAAQSRWGVKDAAEPNTGPAAPRRDRMPNDADLASEFLHNNARITD